MRSIEPVSALLAPCCPATSSRPIVCRWLRFPSYCCLEPKRRHHVSPLAVVCSPRARRQCQRRAGTGNNCVLPHGEKPSRGYGQFTCQGLNRALALPWVLLAKFGRPQYLSRRIPTSSFRPFRPVVCDSPLATIEPTAVRVGRDVWTKYRYNDIAGLQARLITPAKAGTTVFVLGTHLPAQTRAKHHECVRRRC